MRHFGPQHRLPSLDTVEESLRPYIAEAFWSDNQYWMVFITRKLLAEPNFLNAVG
jgi:twitching motility protein PilI